jgi:hypothetical protein
MKVRIKDNRINPLGWRVGDMVEMEGKQLEEYLEAGYVEALEPIQPEKPVEKIEKIVDKLKVEIPKVVKKYGRTSKKTN